jgi:hypothetical protein
MRVSKADVEEFAPNRFLIRDMRAKPILRGEGELQGVIFELRTWRREGLLARLRGIGLRVLALEDQLHALPNLPHAPPVGLTGWRSIANNERYSRFDAHQLSWVSITPNTHDGKPAIEVAIGHPLRRRTSRGAAEYYLAASERHGGFGLQLVDETRALLTAYAILAARRPVVAYAKRDQDALLIPMIELPAQHHTLMGRIANTVGEDWQVPTTGEPFAREVYARLGVEVYE